MVGELAQAYVAGLTSAFTPCVYPLIPVTLAIFGATADSSRGRAIFLAICYVLGIAATYTAIGLVTAQTGALFGQFLGNIWVVGFLTLFLGIIALFALDLIAIPGLARAQSRASAVGGVGPLPAFLMGTVSGIVAAPCVGPFLVAILSVAAKSGNLASGALLLFTYSLGFGTLFVALAAFPRFARALPRPGSWMGVVKIGIAAALMLVIFTLWKPFLPSVLMQLLAAPAALWGAFIVGTLLACVAVRYSRAALRLPAAVFLGITLLPLMSSAGGAALPPSHGATVWLPAIPTVAERPVGDDRIVFVDLAAEWCAACKELEKITFVDPEVASELGKFVTVRLDLTVPDEAGDAFQRRYRIVGLPTLLFLRPDGTEVPQSRITGFIEPAPFLKHLRLILNEQG